MTQPKKPRKPKVKVEGEVGDEPAAPKGGKRASRKPEDAIGGGQVGG